MNSNTRTHCPRENNCTGQNPFPAPIHGTSPTKGRDIVDQPFPNKPVYHKRLVNPTSHVQGSMQINNNSSRPPARELYMGRVIQEKQLTLQKKLWKVEDALRQKNQKDNAGVKDSQANMEDKYYGFLEKNVECDTNPRHKTELTVSEMMYQGGEKNSKQYKFRQDAITKKHKEETIQDKKPTENAVARWNEESQKTNIYKKTNPKGQQKTRPRLTTRDQERIVPEKLQPLVSRQTLKLELVNNTDKNDQRLPCKSCNRKFNCDRLEKHEQICEKVKNSGRPVFNSHMQRIKGKKTLGREPLT